MLAARDQTVLGSFLKPPRVRTIWIAPRRRRWKPGWGSRGRAADQPAVIAADRRCYSAVFRRCCLEKHC